ncbi:hypothetical protein Tco_0446106 [Tanacetum coccineum]
MNDVHNEYIKSHNDMIKSRNELFKTMQSLGEMLRQREQATNLSTHTPETSRCFNSICYDDDDDEESTIPLNEITSQIPSSIAITPVLPTMEPENSLIIRDEDLRTIPEKESEEFIKSSVEDLVPIPRESEDTSDSDKECDLPFCSNSVTFSNPLYDSNDDFISSNDESLPEEDDIESKDYYVSNLDEPALLVTPLSDANEDECFDPGGDIDEIDAFVDIDVSTDIEDDYHDSEGNVSKPGHLSRSRLGCVKKKVATWNDLAFKIIILGWKPRRFSAGVTDIHKRTKTKPKWTKPSTRLEEREKMKPKAYSSLMGQPVPV